MEITQKLSYGVYAVTALDGGRPTGCIANCAVQITSSPATFAVSINHTNHTNKCIRECGRFCLSVLATDCDPSVIGTLGFKSGRDTDKLTGIKCVDADGLPAIDGSCGYIVCDVINSMETATHTVFLGELRSSKLLRDADAMTYDYYHKVIKGKAPAAAPTFVPSESVDSGKKRKFVCSLCGYEFEGDELPEGYVCPICGAGAELFEEQ